MYFDRDPKKLFPHDYILKGTILPFIPKFVRPNHITMFRMAMVPIVLWLLLAENYAVGVPVFLFTAFTDALDGTLARVRKQITTWGMFYDPVADKLLIGSVIVLIVVKFINPWFAFIIVFIEILLLIGGFIRKKRGQPAHANIFGKTKMFLQVLGVCFLLIAVWAGVDLFIDFSVGTFSLAIIFALISLFTYGI